MKDDAQLFQVQVCENLNSWMYSCMSAKKKSSKRQGLRFSAAGFGFRYKTEFEEGSGELVNISGGGCASSHLSIPLALQEKVLLLLPVAEGGDVEIGARVIRVDGSLTALIFVHISEEDKARIIRFFARRQREGQERNGERRSGTRRA